MEEYKTLVKDLINQEIGEYITWNEGATREDAIRHMDENGFENLFGNIDGSRTYSTKDAQDFIDKSGAIWDSEIHDLFEEISNDYFFDCLKRGAETLDVVICELVASHFVLGDIAQEEGIEL